ncbi:serine/threonine-protein kinase [Paludisphaera soli]|uniref:serine/threonine-protein kinase n=1 Tax=Paludisphaera soli TaxID=2712865 RepID=UPI0013ED4EB8|nr:serine/threonine-protein kinase [Paludisphaera soli]
MNAPISCPTPEMLRRMLDETCLDGPAWSDVETHVAECPACQDVLERLTSTATEVGHEETCWNGPAPAPSTSRTEVRAGTDAAPGWVSVADAPPCIPGYLIERELGRGGMGVVYLARQIEANRLVAIKMVPSGRGRPEELVRFRLEGESLARLRHPNIVQVYEVGGVDGRPFFSMEYVAGGNLASSFAEDAHAPADAAALVETLARAVHAAHQCGVVHRDLKPANILLDRDGADASAPVPKITDFGLAKHVGDDSGLTQTGQILGTPSYMAPEQASGGWTVGVPADVYALGAILYEALTGRPPFRGDSPWDIMIQVVHEAAPPPSRIRPGLPRDLEVICEKCLAKKPEDRYSSADALAEDLRRWQEGRPIEARPVGAARRVWLWARRHPAYAALGSLLAASVVAGVVGVAVQWRRAERHLDQSRRRLGLATRAIESFYTGVSRDVLLKQPELKELRESLLSTPVQFYGSLRDELEAGGEADRATLAMLVDVLSRLGELNADVGREDDSLEAFRQAAETARRFLRDDPRDRPTRKALAEVLIKAAEVHARTSRPDQARAGLGEALGLLDGLLREEVDDPDSQNGRASCLLTLGDIECDEQHFELSERHYLESIAIRERLVARHPDHARYLDNLGATQNNLAILYAQWNRFDDAGRRFREGLDSRRRLAGEHGELPEHLRKLSSSLNNVGSFFQNTDRMAEAPAYFREALTIQEALVRDHPTVALYQDDLAVTHENMAAYEAASGRRDRARAEYGQALKVRERLAADHPASLDYQTRLIQARTGLSAILLQDYEYMRAEAEALAAVEAADRASRLHSGSAEFRRLRAETSRQLGDVFAATGRSARAESAYSAALSLLGGTGSGDQAAEVRQDRARDLLNRGVVRRDAGRRDEGEADVKEALAVLDSLLAEQPGVSRYRILAAAARATLAEWALRDARRSASLAVAAELLGSFTQAAADMERLLQDEPDESARDVLARARAGRAKVLEAEGRFAESMVAWDAALGEAPPRRRLLLSRGRAATLCRAGRGVEALEVALRSPDPAPETLAERVAVARIYARAEAAAAGPDRDRLAAEAVARLAAAAVGPDVGDGLAFRTQLDDPDFDDLRTRPDFRAILQSLPLPDDAFSP